MTSQLATFQQASYEYFRAIEVIQEISGPETIDRFLNRQRLPRSAADLTVTGLQNLAVARLIYAAQRELGIQGLSFLIARKCQVTDLGIFGYAMLTASTIGQALQISSKYNRRFGQSTTFEIIAQPQSIQFQFTVRGMISPYDVTYLELWTAIAWRMLTQMMSKSDQHQLKAINVNYPLSSKDKQIYQKYYDVPILNDKRFCGLVFEPEVLSCRLETASDVVAEVLVQQCDQIYNMVNRKDGLVEAVRQELLNKFGDINTPLNIVANNLGLSPRSLRRKLHGSGTSYKLIRNEISMTIAREYLLNANMSHDEIAYALGYSQPSAFYRAFRNWFGTTPKIYSKKSALSESQNSYQA